MSERRTWPSAVLFDLDGTLVDTSVVWRPAYLAVARELDVDLPGGWWSTVRGRSLEASLAVFGPAENPGLEASLVDQATTRLSPGAVRWLPGARELLQAVRAAGIATAVVTSTWRVLAERILDVAGGEVSAIVGGDEVTRGKPAPDPYLLAARRLDVAPAHCLAVEDSTTGVAAAEAAAMAVLVVPSSGRIARAPGRHLVASLAEVSVADLPAMTRP